jgi:hypothetical protein
MSARELAQLERRVGAGEPAPQVRGERLDVQPFVGADRGGVDGYCWNSRRMRRATTMRCTSSGPS